MNVNTCVIIVGPTASGKTSLSAGLARAFNTDIISADSRQCYREMNIGVAKPPGPLLSEIRHYFIDSHSIFEDVNAALFEQYALASVEEVFARNPVAVMVGGTGLYIQAFCSGMDEIPAISRNIRNEIIANYEKYGLAWLQDQVRQVDPAFFEKGEIYNPQRLMRSLEIKLSTGRSITTFHTNQQKQRDFHISKIGLELPRAVLYDNINNRVDEMMAAGLLDEVQALFPFRHLNALNTVGYKELFEYLEGRISKDAAIELIKKNTRNYAKRQITWFKKDSSVRWFSPNDTPESIIKALRN